MSRSRVSPATWWITRFALPIVVTGGLAIALGRSSFDRDSLVPFFDAATGAFPMRRDWFFEGVLHVGGKWTIVACTASLVVAAAMWWRDPRRGANARRFAYLAACLLVTTGVAALWKQLAHPITPWDTTHFGGSLPWPGRAGNETLFDVIGSPGAHASSGFAWISLFFVGASLGTRHRWLWLGPGLCLGSVFALGQHVRGAHQPSHELWSLAIAWTTACSLAFAFRALGWLAWKESPAPSASGTERTRPERALPWLVGGIVGLGAVSFFATDMLTEQLEKTFEGSHFAFEVVELIVTALGLGIAAWLLADKISTMREREAQRMDEEREKRFRVLGRMAASVAHEVRNPLQTVRLIVDEQRHEVAGLRDHPLQPEFEASLERIDRAVDLVYRLARPESGEAERTDLAEAARDAVVAQARISGDLVTFAWEREPPRAVVASSRTALRIVIDNLLRNAVEASPRKGIVELGLDERGPWWALRIRNRGSLGARRDAPERSAGLGLGVPISRQIATNAGGEIELAEADGHVICTLLWPREAEVAI